MWIYPVIAKADLRVFEEIDCFEFDAASLPVVHEVGGSHLVSFHHRVLICFHLPRRTAQNPPALGQGNIYSLCEPSMAMTAHPNNTMAS